MANVPFMRGAQALCTFFMGSAKREILVDTWDISRVIDEATDGVNGEDRDRVDATTRYYDVSLGLWVVDTKLVDALLEYQAVDDSGVQPLDVSFALGLKPRDGSKFAMSMREGCILAWKLNSGGRTPRLKKDLPLRFRYVDKTPL